MKPVDQTRTYSKDDGKEPPGNCFQACVASIFELELHEVPDEMEHWQSGYSRKETWEPYWRDHTEWLKGRGLADIEVTRLDDSEWVDMWCVITGPSPRDSQRKHSVVGFGTKIKHDPHPSRDGLGPGDRTYIYFTAIDPMTLIHTNKIRDCAMSAAGAITDPDGYPKEYDSLQGVAEEIGAHFKP